jgi:hypothetical protein
MICWRELAQAVRTEIAEQAYLLTDGCDDFPGLAASKLWDKDKFVIITGDLRRYSKIFF